MSGSARIVSSFGLSVLDDSVSDTIGWSAGSNFLMIGSFISTGSLSRIPEIASRTSCAASSVGLEYTNCTMICAKPSVDVDEALERLFHPVDHLALDLIRRCAGIRDCNEHDRLLNVG